MTVVRQGDNLLTLWGRRAGSDLGWEESLLLGGRESSNPPHFCLGSETLSKQEPPSVLGMVEPGPLTLQHQESTVGQLADKTWASLHEQKSFVGKIHMFYL